MRIAYVLPALSMGGAEQVVRLLAQEMIHQHSVLVIGAFGGGDLEPAFREAGIPLVVLHGKRHASRPIAWGRSFVRSVAGLRQQFEAFRPDIINVHMLGPGLDALFAARRAGVRRMFLTLHNTYPLFASPRWRDRLQRTFLRALFARFTAVIAVSDEVRDWAVTHRMVRPDRIFTVENGIDLRPFAGMAPREGLRAANGVPVERFVFITVASLRPKKGHAVLLDAIAQMPPADREKALFLLVGDGETRPDLEAQAGALGIGEQVRLLGLRRDVPELLAQSDAFVLPSHFEGLPLALIEAMAAGLCVVSTRVAGSTLLLRDGRNGILVPSGDARALAEKLTYCVRHPEEARALGREARRTATEQFSAERMARDTEAAFLRFVQSEVGVP